MSSKKRRAKKDETPQNGEAAASRDAAETEESAEPASKKEATSESSEKDAKGKKGAKGKKSSLPAFGFATDLLKKSSDDASDDGVANDGVANDGVADDGVANDAVDADELAIDGVDETSPSRIFDFADQVQSRARKKKEDEGPEARWETWVTFHLDSEVFAMPVDPVRQVVRVSSITRVPHAPEPVRGVTNLRGRVIPVIDLRMRVGLEPAEIGRQSRVVAVSSRGRVLGLLVDSVHQVVHLDLNQVQPPPEDVMTVQSDYILGVYHQEDRLILLLDVDRALILRERGAA